MRDCKYGENGSGEAVENGEVLAPTFLTLFILHPKHKVKIRAVKQWWMLRYFHQLQFTFIYLSSDLSPFTLTKMLKPNLSQSNNVCQSVPFSLPDQPIYSWSGHARLWKNSEYFLLILRCFTFIQGVQEKMCFFTIHCNPSSPAML